MTFLLAIFLGLIISIGGIIIPGMLNMTIAKISIKESQKQALNFALGAVVVVFIQSFLGTYFAKFLDANPVFSEGLKKIGTFIFIGLTIAFTIMGFNAKKKKQIEVKIDKKRNRFFYGMALSSFNMFAIPWYALTSLMMASKDLFHYDIVSILLFNLSAALGTYFVFYLYAKFFKKIEHRLTFIVQNINFLIAILTGVVAISSLYKMFF
ncbi:LysE family transporter [Flavobacterium sp. HXWNR69]|uniref:LysE family transporter n=1 Tax=Flavobacterium fragile TaxID=2949085 RepID=A0ABT0TCX2_9FLAO|nr:LysE family transporter [Flavobacterium sp. HXWNR69]MCL9768815.1 LysE family transporter [Flavobacterium sp. HXWNR69]